MSDTHTIPSETFNELVGKSAQRDKVVNEYDLEIGTAKDDELLSKIKNREAGLTGEITKKKKEIARLEEIIKELEEKVVSEPTKDISRKVLELIGFYLLPTAGLTYLTVYLTRVDSEAALAIAPTINLIIFILKQESEKLMLKLGIKKLKKADS